MSAPTLIRPGAHPVAHADTMTGAFMAVANLCAELGLRPLAIRVEHLVGDTAVVVQFAGQDVPAVDWLARALDLPADCGAVPRNYTRQGPAVVVGHYMRVTVFTGSPALTAVA